MEGRPLLMRQPSYDTYTAHSGDDELGEEYLSKISRDAYSNFTKKFSRQEVSAIDVYQSKLFYMMNYALEKDKLADLNRVARILNEFQLPESATPIEIEFRDMIKKQHSLPDFISTVRVLDNLFESMPPSKIPLVGYRCYGEHIFIRNVGGPLVSRRPGQSSDTLMFGPGSSNKRYISFSLSKKMVEDWCDPKKSRNAQSLQIFIIVPQGTRGVLPLFLFKKEYYRQNEITLSRKGHLLNTGLFHHKGCPIFIYTESPTEDIAPYLNQIQAGDYNLIKPEQVYHFGGKRNKTKRNKNRLNFTLS